MHGDAFGKFNQQKSARTAFSNASGSGERVAGGSSGRSAPSSSALAQSLPVAAAASASHVKSPAPVATLVPGTAALVSSSSSSDRRASVTFSPLSTTHSYTVPPLNDASHHNDDDDDNDDEYESVEASTRDVAESRRASAISSLAVADERAVSCIRFYRFPFATEIWFLVRLNTSIDILLQFIGMMENMDANDYVAAFDAEALPMLARVIVSGDEEQAAVAWRVVCRCSNICVYCLTCSRSGKCLFI